MTPSQLKHLKLIDAHCERMLAIAEKRTPGEWGTNEGQFVCDENHGIAECYHRDPDENDRNAAFIASCAGNAEAGWRATRATIDWLIFMHDHGEGWRNVGLVEDILATFPLELIQKP